MNLIVSENIEVRFSVSEMMDYLEKHGFKCSVEIRDFSQEEPRGEYTLDAREVVVVQRADRYPPEPGTKVIYEEIKIADEYNFREKSNVLKDIFSQILSKRLLNL